MRGGSVLPGVDTKQPAAAHLDQRVAVEDLDTESCIGTQPRRDLGHPSRRQVRGRAVREIARNRRRRGHDAAALRTGRNVVGDVGRRHQRDLCDGGSFGLAPQRVVRVAREQDALDRRLARGSSGNLGMAGDGHDQVFMLVSRPRERGRGITNARRVHRVRISLADRNQHRPVSSRHHEDLPDLALEAESLQVVSTKAEIVGHSSIGFNPYGNDRRIVRHGMSHNDLELRREGERGDRVELRAGAVARRCPGA